MAATFYVIRHGQTDWNFQKRIQGQSDIPLNELGRKEAQQMAKKLQDVPFSLCISSDLLRCMETATLCQNGAIKSDRRLRERDFRNWEGEPASHYLAASKEEREKVESDDSLTNRVFEALNTYSDREGNVLVVTHGGVLRILLKNLLPLDCDLQQIHTANLSLIKMTISDGKWQIVDYEGILFSLS